MITITNVDDLLTTTMTPTTTEETRKNPSTRSLFQRRRKRRNVTSSVNGSVNSVSLDADERAKLCRLVAIYKALRRKSDDGGVSPSVYLYRVDPKVLTSPLEEVNLAFGSRQKAWLVGFDEAVMSLWGSFVRMG